ncbi:MAG: DNA starvation/stationary phase protection protein Dps [Phycisphaerales bacterium]|nr:MAG: DNA starvation/stationary phase protection protein Dps [Phycisphaerales bacterium]
MRPTRHDLPAEARATLVSILNERLADAVVLATHAKQAHWNVRGPSFIALHELFDDVAAKAHGHADLIAERAAALGGVALGDARSAAARTVLADYPADIVSGNGHVEALAGALGAFAKGVRGSIAKAGELGDEASADVLTEIVRETDQLLWFVEAHLHADR